MTAMSLYATEQLYLRIFLSSPGDVTDERSLAKEVIERLRSERAHRNRLRLEIVAWDKPGAGTAMPAHLEPQEALNQRLKKPSDCDIVIVIFGYRMGTPLSEKYRKPNGDRYWSGTEYEYLDAVHTAKEMGASIMESATSPLLCEAKAPQYRRHRAFEDADDHPEWPKVADTVIEAEMGIPEVLVYRKKGAPDVNAADRQRKEKLEQWDRVEEFFAGFKNPDGSFRSYYEEYATPLYTTKSHWV